MCAQLLAGLPFVLYLDLQTREKFAFQPPPCSMGARDDLTVEPNCSTLAFSLKGGGVLYESSSPNLEASNPSERFVTDLVLARREKEDLTGEPYCSTLAFSLKGEVFSMNHSFPILRLLTQVNGS